MSLYCPIHRVFASKRHRCDALKLITITKECKGIADGLYDLMDGVGPLSVAHFITPVIGVLNKFYINLYIDLPRDFPIKLLGDFPLGWMVHRETVSDDHLPILVIAYSETFVYSRDKTVNQRTKEIILQFEDYIKEKDPLAIKSILTLMYS